MGDLDATRLGICDIAFLGPITTAIRWPLCRILCWDFHGFIDGYLVGTARLCFFFDGLCRDYFSPTIKELSIRAAIRHYFYVDVIAVSLAMLDIGDDWHAATRVGLLVTRIVFSGYLALVLFAIETEAGAFSGILRGFKGTDSAIWREF